MSELSHQSQIGQCHLTRIDRPDRGGFDLRIGRADPQIEICGELLDEIFNTEDYQSDDPPWMAPKAWIDFKTKTCADHNWECPPAPGICYKDGLLHLEGINRHVVYLIGDWIPERNTWLATWPD